MRKKWTPYSLALGGEEGGGGEKRIYLQGGTGDGKESQGFGEPEEKCTHRARDHHWHRLRMEEKEDSRFRTLLMVPRRAHQKKKIGLAPYLLIRRGGLTHENLWSNGSRLRRGAGQGELLLGGRSVVRRALGALRDLDRRVLVKERVTVC